MTLSPTTTTMDPGGAPAAPPSVAPPGATGQSLVAQVAALRALSVPQLREKYAEVFGEPTRSRNREWLFRSVAWQVQALAEGGLSERARRRAVELARESDVRPRREPPPGPDEAAPKGTTRMLTMAPVRDPRTPLPGAVLVRTYRGQNIRVRVLDDRQYEYEGKPFRSLTAVVAAVTGGSHQSGARFFGIAAPLAREAARR